MVGENTKRDRKPLLPLRHEQRDFFVCDIFDAAPKADMASMAHPIFTLSTKPDTKVRRYESPDGISFVEIKPNVVGLATVHDRDVLIYCISQVMAALKTQKHVHRILRFKAYDLLVATNRGTDGRGYEQLRAALDRLQGTRIETNITTNGIEQIDMFGLIDRVRVVRETRGGRMLDLEITLSDWVFNAIEGEEVLTLNRQYFQLRKPLERRLYELARKQCGAQSEWKCGLAKLQARTGSTSSEKEFKRLVKAICKADEEHGHMPDYAFRLLADILIITPKSEFLETYATEPMENRNGLIVQAELTHADGHGERKAALEMINRHSPGSTRRLTLGADKGYDSADFIAALRRMVVTPHVAQKARYSAIDDRTTRHPGYAISQRNRKKIEEPFGWAKTVGGMAQTTLRGVERVCARFTLTMVANNLARLPRLLAQEAAQ